MSTLIANVPFWLWLLAAAALSAITVWIYWRCLLADRLSIVETELAARDLALADAQAELAQYSGAGATQDPDDDMPPPPARPETRQEARQDALQAAGAEPGEVESLRYRVWALETRLRAAIDRARAGEPIDPAALSRDLETLTDDGAPLEAISALKYRNWLLENRLTKLSDAAAPRDEAVAALPAAREGDADMVVHSRLKDRMARVLTAAKLGNLSDIAEIEREMAEDPDGLATPRLADDTTPPLGLDLAGDGSPAALRYRNWLMAKTLKRVFDRLRAEETVDPDALERMLREETLAAPSGAEPEPAEAVSAESELSSAELQLDAVRRERDRLAEQASGLRYRRWLLSRRLGDVVSGLRDDAAIDPDLLEAALTAEGETPLDNPDAPRPSFLGARRAFADRMAASAPAAAEPKDRASRDEAESLRFRLWLVQAELKRLRAQGVEAAASRPADAKPAGSILAYQAAAAAEKARYWSAEWRAQTMRTRAELVESRLAERDRAASDVAASLRNRLAQAERALRTLRGQAAAAPAPDIAAEKQALSQTLNQEHERLAALEKAARQALSESRAEAAGLRRRLWELEWSDRQGADAGVGAETQAQQDALREEAERAKARLAEAETRRAELEQRLSLAEAARDAAEAQARQALAEASAADPDPMLQAEVETLRDRLRRLERAEGDLSETRRIRDETETLRSRLALYEAENERMRAQLAESARALPAREYREAPRHAAVAASLAYAEPRYEEAPPRPLQERAARSPISAELAAAMAPILESPIAGAEDAARELIDRGDVVARESNRPGGLLSSPQGEIDDLRLIRGIDADRASDLNALGLFHFSQIAEMGPRDLAWIDDRLGLRGAVVRDRWLPQAKQLQHWKAAARLVRLADGQYGLRSLAPREPSRAEPIRQDLARQEPLRQEPLRQEPLRQEPLRQEPTRLESTRPEPTRLEPRPSETRRPEAVSQQAAPRGPVIAELRAAAREEASGAWRQHADAIEIDGPVWGVEMAARDLLRDPEFSAEAEAAPRFPAAPAGAPDDLTAIRRIGPRTAAALNRLGITRFEQIADLTPRAAAWLDRILGLEGAVVDQRWIPQAYGQVERRERAARTAALAARRAADEASWEKSEAQTGERPSQAAAVESAMTEEEQAALALLESDYQADPAHRPAALLDAPDRGEKDDLKEIWGIGVKFEELLNDLGVYYFEQLAALTAQDLAWIDSRLRFRGRAVRDRWIPQARAIVAERRRNQGGG